MEPTFVDDDEKLYRSVDPLRQDYEIVDGTFRVSANAFNDRQQKPSVDRSLLRINPGDARLSKSQGIVQILALEVRRITNIQVSPNDSSDLRTYGVDAVHRPLAENLAHCQIECSPEISRGHFKRVKEALAFLAQAHGLVVGPG